MTDQSKNSIYECIVIGAGASGLFYCAADSSGSSGSGTHDPGRKLILEKTLRPGQKLLMSGNGMCNFTHAGSVKDFVSHYGENGIHIRPCLYRHNNLELRQFMESIGVPAMEREDGKVFPASLKASDVLEALISEANKNNWELVCSAEVTGIIIPELHSGETAVITLSDGRKLETHKLVIATGGASYPSTGSDGSFYQILERDLGLKINEPHPALAPVFVQDFSYGKLSGISFDDVEITCSGHTTRGAMLITHRGFSGPAVLHISQYVKPGDELIVNYLPDNDPVSLLYELKNNQRGNSTGTANYIASEFELPKSFVCMVLQQLAIPTEKKTSSLTGKELESIVCSFTRHSYSVSGTGGWNDAMVTRGGVALDQIDLKLMKIKAVQVCDVRIIGEAIDVNGDTGGYNLQFAYSSAMAALC